MIILEQNDITIRTIRKYDKSLLLKWLSNPALLEFYEGRDKKYSMDMINKDFYQLKDNETHCIIEYNKTAIGFLQFYIITDIEKHEYGYTESNLIIYGMDQFIGEVNYWNKGIGTKTITSVVQYLTQKKKANIIVMDPQITNHRALRVYEKAGFKRIKKLKKHEYHEGKMRDCWLIEYKNSK